MKAIFFDRDGTLIENVPYNGDPEKVVPRPGAREALDLIRARGIPTAMVTNQSGIGRGYLTLAQVASVHARMEAMLGPLGPWLICPHAPHEGCLCRKPAPGLVREAAATLGLDPADCVLIGDQPSDIAAAEAAGARGVLVASPDTPPEVGTPYPDLLAAVKHLLES